jgi:hypothetical protein
MKKLFDKLKNKKTQDSSIPYIVEAIELNNNILKLVTLGELSFAALKSKLNVFKIAAGIDGYLPTKFEMSYDENQHSVLISGDIAGIIEFLVEQKAMSNLLINKSLLSIINLPQDNKQISLSAL